VPILTTGAIDSHVQLMGEGSPVVLIHGLLLGSLAGWYFHTGPALSPNHRVILYDLRGHGRSERLASGYDLVTLAEDLGSVLEATRASGPVDLVGHSYGGLVALRFALDHPARVERLVLVDVPLPPSSMSEMKGLEQSGANGLLEALPSGLRDAIVGGGRRARRFLEGIDFLVNRSSLLTDLAAEQDIPDEALSALECPTLLVFGQTSSCAAVGDRLAAVLPRARLQTLPGGHFLPMEVPELLTRAIVEFLDG